MRTTRIRAALALGATAACAAAGVAVANLATADPYPGNASSVLVAVGSDTTQSVMDALSQAKLGSSASASLVNVDAYDYNYSASGQGGSFGGNTSTDTVYPHGSTGFKRPSGSGDGVAAVSDSVDGQGWPASATDNSAGTAGKTVSLVGQVDIGRSSSAVTHDQGTDLTYVPLARDGIAIAVIQSAANAVAHPIGDLTKAQITDLYNAGSLTINGVELKPWLPQTGSGTRQTFLGALGISDSGNAGATHAYGCHNENILSGKSAACGVGTQQTKSYGDILTETPTTAGDTVAYVTPYSAALWISQNNAVSDVHGGTLSAGQPVKGDGTGVTGVDVSFPTINSASPFAVAPSAPFPTSANPPTVSAGLAPNPTYYTNGLGARYVYNVVSTARITEGSPTYDAGLANFLHADLTSSAANDVLTTYGFLPDTTNDGKLTPGGVVLQAGLRMDNNSKISNKIALGVTPSILGKAQVGQTLVASVGALGAGVTPTYQWRVAGTNLVGQTGHTLVVPASAQGKTISVTVGGSVNGASVYYTTVNSAPTAAITAAATTTVTKTVTKVVPLKTLKTVRPAISGKLVSRKKLTAKPGAWTAGTKFTYAWYVNGAKKSSKSTYTLPKTSKGKVVQLEVTGSKAGYSTVTAASFGKVVTK